MALHRKVLFYLQEQNLVKRDLLLCQLTHHSWGPEWASFLAQELMSWKKWVIHSSRWSFSSALASKQKGFLSTCQKTVMVPLTYFPWWQRAIYKISLFPVFSGKAPWSCACLRAEGKECIFTTAGSDDIFWELKCNLPPTPLQLVGCMICWVQGDINVPSSRDGCIISQ